MPNTCYTIKIKDEISLKDFVNQVNCSCSVNAEAEWQKKLEAIDRYADGDTGDYIFQKNDQWYLKAGVFFNVDFNSDHVQAMLVGLSKDPTLAPNMTFTIVDSCKIY